MSNRSEQVLDPAHTIPYHTIPYLTIPYHMKYHGIGFGEPCAEIGGREAGIL